MLCRPRLWCLALLPCLGACAGQRGPSAPPRDEVCTHLVELVEHQSGGQVGPELIEQIHADCDGSLTTLETRYADLGQCLLDATSVEQVAICEQAAASYDPLLRSLLTPKQTLCVHIGELVADASGGADELDMPACLAELEGIETQLGPARYAEVEACMSATTSVDDFSVCEALIDGRGQPLAGDPERALCEHVTNLLEAEFVGAGEQPPSPSERAEVITGCVESVGVTRAELGEAGFAELVECTLAAQSMAVVMRCNEAAGL